MSRHLFLALAATGLLAASAGHAGEVYQWKDANGVTHYSQTPPPGGNYQLRQITSSGATAAAPAATQAQAPAEDPRCATARANAAALKGSQPVHEAGTEGEPGRALNDAERATQLELAEATIKAYCVPGAG